EVDDLEQAVGAVGVHVIDRQPPAIDVDQDERGAGDIGRHAEAAGDALQKARLSCAQLAHAGHHRARRQPRAELLAHGLRLLGAARDVLARAHARGGVRARGMASTLSPAIMPSSPTAPRAGSPASPCKYPAARSATSGSSPRARKAPVIPVSTSPEPPLAMPGLPVGLIQTVPSGPATSLPAPVTASP